MSDAEKPSTAAGALSSAGAARTSTTSECGRCGSRLIYPSERCLLSDGKLWNVSLRCPECGWTGAARCSGDEVERLDGELDRAAASIRDELRRMERTHMREWADCFSRALELDLIGPDDF